MLLGCQGRQARRSPYAPASSRSTVRSGGNRTRRDQVPRLEVLEQLLRRRLGGLVFGVADPGRVLGDLVWVRDAGEFLDLAGEGLRVETLDIALGAGVDRSLDVDLDEAVAHQLVRLVADLGVGGDRRGDHRHAVAAEQAGERSGE